MKGVNNGIVGVLAVLVFVGSFSAGGEVALAQATPVLFTTEGDGVSWGPILNKDGRFVAFSSYSTNFVPDDTNNIADLFFYDRSSGSFSRTNVSSSGQQSNGQTQYGFTVPSSRVISDDGRFVTFEGLFNADDLVTDDTNEHSDIFVRDRQSGNTTRVSVASGGTEGDGGSFQPSISADGRFVAFTSSASNLVPDDTNGGPNIGGDVFVHDLQTGTTERVSIGPNGDEGNSGSDSPSMSADGRYVAFSSASTNWHSDLARSHIYMRDRTTQTTERISAPVVAFGEPGENNSPIISADGRYVAFQKGSD